VTQARYTTLRFAVSESGAATGFQVTPNGRIDTVSDDLAIRQSILLLLSTTPGERVMRPTYGCPLERFVFAPNDDTTAGLAMHEVRTAIERWEPRVEIVSIGAGPDVDDMTRLVVDVSYRSRTTAVVDAVSVPVQLQV
jgi:phage baseplate assembly protein W